MNMITIAVGLVLVIVISLAAWGCFRNMRSDCCCDGKCCESCSTCRCSILKEIE